MEYVQERIATLHDFDGASPDAPTDRAAVVVPMTERDHASLAAERVLSRLESVAPAAVYVPLRASPGRASEVASWVASFDLDTEVLWCNAPRLEERLAADGVPDRRLVADGSGAPTGKGRDVWLALGLAAAHEYVVVHDADATTYSAADVPRLLYPLALEYDFVKGYYARVEDGRLYGRLFRLFVRPLLRALRAGHDHPLVEYLLAFRYALAGEFAATSDVVRSLRVQPGWGLEVGTLGDAYARAGFEGTAQVDLGTHEHDHRAVGGPEGLGEMSSEVGAALFHALSDHGVDVTYDALRERYREAAAAAIDRYAADAAFNDLVYDPDEERAQVRAYEDAVAPPAEDRRLPAWRECALDPGTVRECSRAALAAVGA